jgi:hypothetical protein
MENRLKRFPTLQEAKAFLETIAGEQLGLELG